MPVISGRIRAPRAVLISGLAAVGLLVMVPGAQAADGPNVGSAPSAVRDPRLRAELDRFFAPGDRLFTVTTAGSAYPGDAVAAGSVVAVMPRGGDDGHAAAGREFDWTPLLIFGGLLTVGVGASSRHRGRHPAQ